MGVGCKLISTWVEVTVNEGMSEEEVLRLFGLLNNCICHSRRRVGRCEFSARLYRYPVAVVGSGGGFMPPISPTSGDAAILGYRDNAYGRYRTRQLKAWMR
jgi:hypothetical protein